jgi:hypothetical protein
MKSLLFAFVFAALPTAVTVAKECTVEQHEADRARMAAASKQGILKPDPESGLDGITLSAFVSDAAWAGMSYIEKLDFVESLICAWAGVGKGILVLHLRSEMTGQAIGEWRLNRLTVPATMPSIRVQREAEREDSSKGSGFSCDATEKLCRCDGDAKGADCTAMKLNCIGDVQCTEFRGVSSCACRMQIIGPPEQAPLVKAPAAGASGKF